MSTDSEVLENCIAKNKRGWFHSLTRRKKASTSPSQHSLANCYEQEETSCNNFNVNNNNETSQERRANQRRSSDESNFFQRLGKKIGSGLKLNSLRRRSSKSGNKTGNGTTDVSGEFLTQTSSPIEAGHQLTFSFADEDPIYANLPQDKEFSYDYRELIAKKWKSDDPDEMKRAMFKAGTEMLNQVWYWGEISRRDAQEQLTDKKTGSFLVRDSETSGFTLSFRIYKRTLHYRLEYIENHWRFEDLEYKSIVEMIENVLYRCVHEDLFYLIQSPNEMQPPFPVILRYPLSRYSKMPLLQDLCRRVIQRNLAKDEIVKLPIPPKLQEYLAEEGKLIFSF